MSEQSASTSTGKGRGCHWGGWRGYTTGYSRWGSDDPAGSAGGRHGTPEASPDAPDLRVSDDERNAVARDLSQHFEAGRLDMTEFEERTERALGARNRRDLAGLLADLPPLRPSNQDRRPRHRGPRLWLVLPVVLLVFVVLSATSVVIGARHGAFFPWFLIPIGVFVALRFRRRGWRAPSQRS